MKKRLEVVYEMIDAGKTVADIGTDHAYIPCLLMENNKAKHCYACDIVEGPLNAAKENIQKKGLNEKIDVILSDGLLNVPPKAEVIVLAGMGFFTAREILEKGLPFHPQVEQIVIQVNKDVDFLRQWVCEKGYRIDEEKIVKETHFYQILSVRLDFAEKYSEKELFLGPMLLKNQSDTFRQYLEEIQTKNKLIQGGISKSSDKYKIIQNQLNWIAEELATFKK